MKKWSIEKKTLNGFVGVVLVLLAVIAGTYYTGRTVVQSSLEIRLSQDTLSALERVYSARSDMISSQRAYLITADPFYLDERAASGRRLQEQLLRLQHLTQRGDAGQRQRLARLEDAIAQHISLMEEAMEKYRAGGIDAIKNPAEWVQGRDRGTVMQNVLREMQTIEQNRLQELLEHDRSAVQRLYALVALFLLSASIALGWLLTRILGELRQRQQAESHLQQSNAFLESLIENIPTMVFAKDSRNLRFVRLNRAGEELIGYPREQLIGKSDHDFFPAEEADFFVSKDREVLASGRIVDIPEEEIDTRERGRRILHTRKVPVPGADGHPALLLGISMDITEQKAAEREIRQLNAELKRNAELLQASNQELESFCYSVSHDLRAPLRAVDGFARILEEEYGPRLEGEGLRYLHTIRNGSQRMARLIDDLLEFSRLGRQSLNVGFVDMTAISQRALDDVLTGRTTTPPRIALQPLVTTHGDQRMLHHVWLNLIDNAVKYSSSSPEPVISIWSRRDGDETIYSVQDNGIGFDMRYCDKLFGVFQRLHSSEDFPGTGVGLAIVQRIIARHGGRVWAESAPGQGATFHFTIPATAA